jgi:hypothetical protein
MYIICDAGVVVDLVRGAVSAIYGPAHRKTYKSVYDGGRLRKRRV